MVGPPVEISQRSRTLPVSVTSGQGTSDEINYAGYVRGSFILPAAFTSTAVTFTVAEKAGGTFTPLYNSSNTAVSITVAQARAYPLPSELAGCTAFKFVFGSNEASTRTVYVNVAS